ncbi:MAG: hypothetical protein WCW52_06625 [Elusimicrobiales bacterium]|jgi:hypothetical protein
MNCPVCSKVLPDGSKVCTGCAADLSKWRPKQEIPPNTPAVILEQRNVFTMSSLLSQLAPFARLFGVLALFCALLYGGYRGYIAYILRAETGNSAVDTQAEAAQLNSAVPEVRLSTAGFERLYQEYSAQAAALNIPTLKNGATDYFQSGVRDIETISFAAMEEAGINVTEEPFTQEELAKAGQEKFSYKCAGEGKTEYLTELPEDNRGRSLCWIIKPESKWVQAQWLPKLHRWSPWTAEQLISGAEKYTEKIFGPAAVEEEKAKTETLIRRNKKKKQRPAAGNAEVFLGTFKTRFQREGALAALERMRALTAPAPQSAP